MTVVETLLVFAGVPLAVMLLFAAIVFGFSAGRGVRYRPDLPYDFNAVWFLAPTDPFAKPSSRPALTAAPSPEEPLTQGGAREVW